MAYYVPPSESVGGTRPRVFHQRTAFLLKRTEFWSLLGQCCQISKNFVAIFHKKLATSRQKRKNPQAKVAKQPQLFKKLFRNAKQKNLMTAVRKFLKSKVQQVTMLLHGIMGFWERHYAGVYYCRGIMAI